MEWGIVAVIGAIVLLFGSKKLPEMARGLGQSMRIIKSETRGLTEDDERAKTSAPRETAPGETAPGRAAGEGTAAESKDPTPGT